MQFRRSSMEGEGGCNLLGMSEVLGAEGEGVGALYSFAIEGVIGDRSSLSHHSRLLRR